MLKPYSKFFFLTASLIALTACQKIEETKTVEYYKAHADERKSKLAECGNNAGELSKTPNCINATKADASESLGESGIKMRR